MSIQIFTLAREVHQDNVDAGWWTNIETGEPLERDVDEMLMLQVTELAEAMEGYRKNLMDDKLPQYKMLDVELADFIIRNLDLLGYLIEYKNLKDLSFELMQKTISLDVAKQNVPSHLLFLTRQVLHIQNVFEQYHVTTLGKALEIGVLIVTALEICKVLDIRIKEIIDAKRAFNKTRADHKIENRLKEGGKKC